MILADVNVMVNAFRDDAESHDRCRRWLDEAVRGEAAFGAAPLVLSAVVRISTNRKAFDPPSKVADAIAFCDEILAQPHCMPVQPGPRHWSIFTDLCRKSNIKAAMVTDAWFAALAIEHGCEGISLDRDFRRFPGLRWRNPD